jgi:hypothetical protein
LWIFKVLPKVEVREMDLIPRKSPGYFIMGIRHHSSHATCLKVGQHKRVSCWPCFVVRRRNGAKKKGGAENRGGGGGGERYELRRELYQYDGVHLNVLGQRILTKILTWLLNARPNHILILRERFPRQQVGAKVLVDVELKAYLKF